MMGDTAPNAAESSAMGGRHGLCRRPSRAGLPGTGCPFGVNPWHPMGWETLRPPPPKAARWAGALPDTRMVRLAPLVFLGGQRLRPWSTRAFHSSNPFRPISPKVAFLPVSTAGWS